MSRLNHHAPFGQLTGRRVAPARAGRFQSEPLESRLLLCFLGEPDLGPVHAYSGTSMAGAGAHVAADCSVFPEIRWTNRGGPGNDSDGFQAVFGTGRMAVARAVVDAALDDWERIMVDFRHLDNCNLMEVTVNVGGTGFGGSGGATEQLGGVPKKGGVTLLGGTLGQPDNGWFLDPTPGEHSEFTGNIINGFSGDAPAGSAVANQRDLYTVVVAEMAHVMGLDNRGDLNWDNAGGTLIQSTGTPDTSEGGGTGFFYTFQSPDVTQLLTSFNSGNGGQDRGFAIHTAGPTTLSVPGRGTFSGSQDGGNAIFERGRRYLVPNNVALMLKNVYDYNIVMPEQFGTFYSVLQGNGTLLIRGGTGGSNDVIDVNRVGNNIEVSVDIGNDVAGSGPTDPFLSYFPVSAVQRVQIQSGDGSDTLNIYTSVTSPIDVTNSLGTNDTLQLWGTPGDDNIHISRTPALPLRNVYTNFATGAQVVADTNFPVVKVFAGAGNDDVLLNNPIIPSLTINGGDHDDTITPINSSPTTVNGDAGNDTLAAVPGSTGLVNFNGGNDTDKVRFGFRGFGFPIEYRFDPDNTTALRRETGTPQAPVSFSSVEDVEVNAGEAADKFVFPIIAPSYRVTARGGEGGDTFSVGGGLLASDIGPASMDGEGGNDVLELNNTNSASPASWDVGAAGVVLSRNTGLSTFNYGGFESVRVLAGGDEDAFVVRNGVVADVLLHGGGGRSTFTVNGSRSAHVFVEGGFGTQDTLLIDDRNLPLNLYGNDLYPDRWTRSTREVDPNTGNLFLKYYTVDFSGIDSLDVMLGAAQNGVEVFGTSGGIPLTRQTTIWGNVFEDVVNVYTRDAAGRSTIPSHLGIILGDGADEVSLIDNSSVDTTYVFYNPFGADTADIAGLGAGLVGVYRDVESLSVLAGSGDDTFEVETFHSGNTLHLYGRGGDDTLKLTPNSRNLPSGITSIAALGYDGGTAGKDKVELFNQDNVEFWSYSYDLQTAALVAMRTSPGGYALATFLTDVEQRFIHRSRRGTPGAPSVQGGAVAAAPAGDGVFLGFVMPGTSTTIDGGGGGYADQLWIGGFFFDLRFVLGAVHWIGDGLDTALVLDGTDGTGDTVHITGSSVGATPGDNLFGSGGSLEFEGLAALELQLGTGADTVFVQPNATAAITVHAGESTSDSMTVQLAGAQDPTLTQGQDGVGTYAFANRQPVRFSGTESVQVVATAVMSGRYLFYNNSALDGRDSSGNAQDDAAIAVDKTALLPGQAATWANATNYGKGINGIMVDVAGLPAAVAPSPQDFRLDVFAGGNWSPASAAPTVSVRRGAGTSGSDRVTLVLPDGAVSNTWLRVTMLATPATALSVPDVFYFGNLIGDTGDAGTPPFRVNALDVAAVKRALNTTSEVAGRYDFNRDGRVNALDIAAVRQNLNRTLATLNTAAASTLIGVPPDDVQGIGVPPSAARDDADSRRVWEEFLNGGSGHI